MASYRTFELSLSKGNVFENISIKDLPLRLENELVTIFERRFCTPRALGKSFEGSVKGWKKDHIEIEVICPSTTVFNTRFLPEKKAAEIAHRQAKHERKQLARPLSP